MGIIVGDIPKSFGGGGSKVGELTGEDFVEVFLSGGDVDILLIGALCFKS